MKSVIITGASRGIGLATTKKFLTQGYQVIDTYYQTNIPLKHNKLHALKLNQGSPNSIIKTTNQIKNNYSPIDALVNNAAFKEGYYLIHSSKLLESYFNKKIHK